MPRTRTPPPLQPAGYEKSSSHIDISVTETEMALWRAVFGDGKMVDRIRIIINREAYLLAGVEDTSGVKLPSDPEAGHAARDEISRHVKAMKEILK